MLNAGLKSGGNFVLFDKKQDSRQHIAWLLRLRIDFKKKEALGI